MATDTTSTLTDPFGGSPANWSLSETVRDVDFENWWDESQAKLAEDEAAAEREIERQCGDE